VRELISVQWLSCQNWQGISAKSGFLLSVKRGREELNSHFKKQAVTETTTMVHLTMSVVTATTGVVRLMIQTLAI
jgi:hypothetical protein